MEKVFISLFAKFFIFIAHIVSALVRKTRSVCFGTPLW